MSLASYARAVAAEAADAFQDLAEDALNPNSYAYGNGQPDQQQRHQQQQHHDHDFDIDASPRTARSRLGRKFSMNHGSMMNGGVAGGTSSTLSKKIKVDGTMPEQDIVATLQHAKQFPHFNTLTMDEVIFTADIAAAVIDLLKHSVLWASYSSLKASSRQRRGSVGGGMMGNTTTTTSETETGTGENPAQDATAGTGLWDRLNIEFCEGPAIYVQMVIQTAIVLDCVKHLFVASDDKLLVNEWLCGPFETSLRCNVNMTSLWLLVPVTEPLAKSLGHGLAYNTCLEKLSLSGSTWDYDAPAALVDGTTTTMTTTNKNNNTKSPKKLPPGSEDMGILVTTSGKKSSSKTKTIITPGLSQNETLRTLDLSCCSLDDESLSTIIFGIEQHSGLHYLDISRNFSRYRTMTALGQLLQSGICPLKTLDLREQTKRGNLKDVLDTSLLSQGILMGHDVVRLEKLKLSHNNLTDVQVVELGYALKDNTSLQELDLQWNQISDRGVQMFTNALPDISGLRILLLGGNAFGKAGHTLLEKLPDDDDSIVTVKENGTIRKGKSSRSSKGGDGGGNESTDDDDDDDDSSSSGSYETDSDDSSDDDDDEFYSVIEEEGEEEESSSDDEEDEQPRRRKNTNSSDATPKFKGGRMPASYAEAFDVEESSPGPAYIGDL